MARALGNSNNQKVLPLLTPLVTNPNVHANVRKEALKGLANFVRNGHFGSMFLLSCASLMH